MKQNIPDTTHFIISFQNLFTDRKGKKTLPLLLKLRKLQ